MMTNTNIFGPGHVAAAADREVTTRPTQVDAYNNADTWFAPCVNGDPNTGTRITHQWLNLVVANLRDFVRSFGATQGKKLDDMLAEAGSRAASLGVHGVCSGSANSYAVAAAAAVVPPKTLFHGMIVVTTPNHTNDGAATANVFGLGGKKLLAYDGLELASGALEAGRPTAWQYWAAADSGAGAWILLPWANATGATDGGGGGDDPGEILRTLVYEHTGADQDYVVPSGVANIDILVWGAASNPQGHGAKAPGGFVQGTLAVTPGTAYKVIVGGQGVWYNNDSGGVWPGAYGFGGGPSDDAGSDADGGRGGGGLSGLFSGSGTVLHTDTSRALLVAGGGGGGVTLTPYNQQPGRNGGSPSAGGVSGSMRGASGTASAESGGGGGGYAGGAISGATGNGGTNYAHSSITSPVQLYTPDGATATPNSANAYAPADFHGRVIIIERA